MKSLTDKHLCPALVFMVAIVSRWPAVNSWWCLDDWGQLARAAGILTRDPGLPARWLSQDLWWTLTWPVLGLNTVGHAVLRLALHGVTAVLVARLARRGTGRAGIGLLAGVLFAITPVAFTVLYWASGIQELLAGVLVLAAVERWWAGGRGYLWQTAAFGVASVFAKEPGFGLPVLLAVHILWQGRRQLANQWFRSWLVVAILLVAVGIESSALLNNFAIGPADAYRLGGPSVVIGNIGIFGWWLGTPGPIFTSQFTWTIAGVGSLLFVTWGAWGWWCWRRQRKLALTTLIAALLTLGPSLMLVQQTHPYLAYVAAAALSIALADLYPRRWLRHTWLMSAVVLLATATGLGNMVLRQNAVAKNGQPADPVIRSATLARHLAPAIRAQAPKDSKVPPLKLILLQLPIDPVDIERAARFGDRYVKPSVHHSALGGSLGAQLLAGPGSEVVWVNSLLRAPPEARVLCETGQGFETWGSTWEALLYATLSDMMLGNFERAADELARALDLNSNLELFIPDPGHLEFPQTLMLQQGVAFQDWLSGNGAAGMRSPDEITRLRLGVRQVMITAWRSP